MDHQVQHINSFHPEKGVCFPLSDTKTSEHKTVAVDTTGRKVGEERGGVKIRLPGGKSYEGWFSQVSADGSTMVYEHEGTVHLVTATGEILFTSGLPDQRLMPELHNQLVTIPGWTPDDSPRPAVTVLLPIN